MCIRDRDYIKKAAQIKTKSIDNKANVSVSAGTEEKLAKAAEYLSLIHI